MYQFAYPPLIFNRGLQYRWWPLREKQVIVLTWQDTYLAVRRDANLRKREEQDE